MKIYDSKYERISTVSTFLLVPLSGLATDIFLPSFPEMQVAFRVSTAQTQMILTYFFLSYGISMFFVGSLVDTFGRYRLVLASLLVFALSSFALAISNDIYIVYAMRIIQGITTAIIVIGKRAFLVDIYSGAKLKHYMSLLSIIWAIAPISAPFLGGYIQKIWGWQANFYVLGAYAVAVCILELRYSGESIKEKKRFELKPILGNYRTILRHVDFTLGLFVLGAIYSMIMVFGMSAPFIVERHFGLSAIATGYCALLSGLAMMLGGLIGKALIQRPLLPKVTLALCVLMVLAVTMYLVGLYVDNIFVLMVFVFLLHAVGGFMYNSYFTYCLTRFPQYAGTSSGLASGGSALFTSVMSMVFVTAVPISQQYDLSYSYFVFSACIAVALIPLAASFRKMSRS